MDCRNDYDEEEALKWATLQRLPTYKQLRKGLFRNSVASEDHGICEVDIKQLGMQEKKDLLEILMSSDGGNEKLLCKVRDRFHRVGIELPKIEVKFEHLHVDAKVYVGSRALPTVFNYVGNVLENFLTHLRILPSGKKHLRILRNVSGIIKPGRMTLLLGPPGCGKTTLLQALAGKLDRVLEVSGNVSYNGHGMHEFVPQRTAAYISQNDCHIAEMTVRETLAFSARCQGVGSHYVELLRREKRANIHPDLDIDLFMKAAAVEGQGARVVTDYVLRILGLETCADTVIGSEMKRGISGGQKKRLTTGEMLVGPSKILLMDEISTGLDSSTTYQIIKSLHHAVHILQGTALISLLQPAPETYDLFDDVIVLSDGYIVYQGPCEYVLEFFEATGFKCPTRKGVADFLQEVTSKQDQEQYWLHKDEPYRFMTSQDFYKAFLAFHVGRKIGDELKIPFDKSKSHPAALATNKYGVTNMELLKACTSREVLLMKRNTSVYIFKSIQLCIMAFVTMTTFLRTEMHRDSFDDGNIYLGALFFSVRTIMFNGLAEISMTIAKLPVFYKQRDLLFYPPWSYALPSWIIKIPLSFIEAFVWVFLTYYVTGLDPNVGRLFKQYVLLVIVDQMYSTLFRCLAAIGRSSIVAVTFGAFALLMHFALGGFVLSRVDVNKWWIWGYWTSPMMYAMNAIAVNEFLGHQWNHVLPNTSEPLGFVILRSRGFFPSASWYWIGVGVLLGCVLLFNFCFILALSFLNPTGKPQAVVPEESYRSRTIGGINQSLSEDRGDRIRRGSRHSPTRTGVILPFEPHSITFDEIKYSVDMPQEIKEQVFEDKLMLLKGVSGVFRPGVLTALMGVSGAGKTTLMDVLAGRKTGGYIEGHITISGYPKKQETFARISGYCEQNDIHSPHVTVYESLLYSAWLRLPQEVDSRSRKMFVEEVTELIELKALRNALVGLPGVSGLSTEQRKRLTIAVELVANPSIIFMDEPTSGLDARAAAIVMRTVRNTVNTGRTVVCTIHQPIINIFEAFDELLLMKQGGQELYVGPLGLNSCELIKYFEEIEGISKIREGYNPATWMLEVTSSKNEMILGVDFTDIYKNSDLYRRNKALIKELSSPHQGSRDLCFPTQYARSFRSQFVTCLWKQRASYWRNPPYTAVRFLFTTFIALMFGTIFWDLGTKKRTRQDLFNSMGSMYSAVMFIGIQNAVTVQPVVAVERTVFYRERAAGMYSSLAYALAQVLVEVPYVSLQTAVYGVIVYSMIGFEWSAAKFFWYLYFMFATLLYYTFYGMMTVALTPNLSIAAILAGSFYGIWNLFSGFVIPRTRMPVWWRWYYWACPVAWSLYGMLASQYGDVKDVLEDLDMSVEKFVESYFGYNSDFVGVVAAVVLGFAILFASIFSFSISVLKYYKR